MFEVNHILDRALRNPNPNPRFAYLAPTYGQAKRIVWDMLKHYSSFIPGAEPNEAELRIDLPNKARIMLLSAETPDSLRGIYLDGVVLDEYAAMNPAVWTEVIRPTLSDRKGWADFISTPKGMNSFYDLHEYARMGKDGVKNPEWFTAVYKASETGLISKEELESARQTMSEDEYLQEYECSFTAALSGAYWGRELTAAADEKRIKGIAHDPSMVVDTYWDLGISDATSIWFVQTSRQQHALIDYAEFSGIGVDEIVRQLKQKPYNYGEFVLPHDAEARDLSSGRTRKQTLYNLGLRKIRVVPRVGTKQESIDAARLMLKKCYFDEVKCDRGLKALAQYQKKWNAKTNVWENAPLHNWASHAADAFQTFALGCREDARDSVSQHRRDRMGGLVAETEYNLFSL